MGTDITMIAEVRGNGKWEMVTEKVFKNPWYDPKSEYFKNQSKFTNVPFDIRNYNVFAMLANIRNENDINPISELKGFPEDLSKESKEHFFSSYGSYLTLKELLDYDWKQKCSSSGYVSQEEYARTLYKGKHPTSWCGDVMGGLTVKISEEEMRKIIEGKYPNDFNPRKAYYTKCTFPAETYAEKAGFFYKQTIPTLKKLIPENGTEEDVRIVFEFDC